MKEKRFMKLLGILALCTICLWGMGEMKSKSQAKVKARTETECLYEKALRAHFKGWGHLGKSGHCYYAYAKHSYSNRKNEIMIVGLQDTVKEIKIPEKIKGKKVTVIHLLSLGEITNGTTLEKLLNTKPAESKTQSITIPRYVEEISLDSFQQEEFLVNLKKFRVSPKNKHFKSKAGVLFTKNGKMLLKYPNKRKVSKYRIPDGVKELSTQSFERARVERITVPNTVKRINYWAFSDAHVKKISLSKNLNFIGWAAFSRSDLREITIPGTVKTIPKSCFSSCNKLKKVTFKDGVKKISDGAFVQSYGLRKLIIPASVKKIEDLFFIDPIDNEKKEEGTENALEKDKEAWRKAGVTVYAKKGSYAYRKFTGKWLKKQGFKVKVM